MPLPIINSIASWVLKQRIHQIELFLKYPNEVQNELLLGLIRQAEKTVLGETYDFESIKNYSTFADRIPISTYEELEPLIERTRQGEQNVFWNEPIKWFAKSSGTTNAKSKFIPVSNAALEDCHYKGSKDLLCLYLNNNEDSQLFVGKSLRLGGSSQIYEDNKTYFGDLSAILIENMPMWAEFSSTPSNKVSLMSEWESKLAAIISETKTENVTSFAGVPSWLLVLMNRMLAESGKENLLELWPNLEVYFHGGVSFEPYKIGFEKLLGKPITYVETYLASEGFLAWQDKQGARGMRLSYNQHIFFEFVPFDDTNFDNNGDMIEKPETLMIHEVEEGKDYAVLISTAAGAWRYLIGDTVRFIDKENAEIIITGRTKHFLSLVGEHLSVDNMNKAVQLVSEEMNISIPEYCVTGEPVGTFFGHHWYIACDQNIDPILLAKSIDEKLCVLNDDYAIERKSALKEVKLTILKENTFLSFMQSKGKVGGQHKFPRVIKGDLLKDWKAFILNQ